METIDQQTSLTSSDEFVWEQECPYDPPHVHTYPGDWQFGGPNDTDPRADPRFKPDSYYYYDDKFRLVHVSSAFICDDQAIDNFTAVANYGPNYRPRWIQVRRNGSLTQVSLPVVYDPETDEVSDT